ncbi:MAG: hypothetical protein R6X32_00345, partial [Chloroflexota bacterium]
MMIVQVKLNKTFIMIGIVVLLAVVLGLVGVLPALSQTTGEDSEAALAVNLATVDESITYQGRLTDNNGDPLSGSYTMRFFLYDAASGGSVLFDGGNQSVTVADGLFTVSLPVSQDTFDGQGLWLAMDVEGQTLSPRQPIHPAPYAMSLRPGAEIRQAATGTAVRAESTEGIGLQGTGQVYGVYGTNSGP